MIFTFESDNGRAIHSPVDAGACAACHHERRLPGCCCSPCGTEMAAACYKEEGAAQEEGEGRQHLRLQAGVCVGVCAAQGRRSVHAPSARARMSSPCKHASLCKRARKRACACSHGHTDTRKCMDMNHACTHSYKHTEVHMRPCNHAQAHAMQVPMHARTQQTRISRSLSPHPQP